MYLKATMLTILGWFIGLLLDANIDFGDPMGFLSLAHPAAHPWPWDCASCTS